LEFYTKRIALEAQLTPYRDAALADVNEDGKPDIFLAGNFYPNNIQMGEYDADYGTVLINKGDGNFSCSLLKGYNDIRELRHIKEITIGKQKAIILARNNDSAAIIRFK
jgi:hypothetical protein